jgi:hypothetical protein
MLGKDKLTKLMDKAFETMDGDSPPDATIGATLLITEVRLRDGSDTATAFYVFSSDPRGWIQRALLDEARTAQMFSGGE